MTTEARATEAVTEGAVTPFDTPDAPVAPEIERRIQEIMRRRYRLVIQGDPEEGYLAKVPELPGCVTAGETPVEALELLQEAMALWLQVALEHGDPIPEPAPMDYELPVSGELALRLPKSLHRRLTERARDEGVSIDQLAVTLLAQGLGVAHRPT